MSRLRVYISGPLSAGNTATDSQCEANVGACVPVFTRLVEMGLSPMLPHLTWYLHALHRVRYDHDRWIELDLPWVEASDILFRMPGVSKGSDMEVEAARRLNIPVVFSFSELSELLQPDEPFPLEPLGEK